MFKPNASAPIEDWITPEHVQVVKVMPPTGQFERIMQKVRELKEQMGRGYLCNEKNRVRRLDGKTYNLRPQGANVRSIKRKQAA